MAKSISQMEQAFKQYGKNGAIKYCNLWKNDIDTAVKELEAEQRKGMDIKIYNQKRVALNNQTKELNACIAAMNKLFAASPSG